MIERRPNLSFAGNQIRLAMPFRLSPEASQIHGREIFLHIPKCAGTNVNFLFAVCCGYARQRYHRLVVSDFQPPIWIAPGWTGAWGEIPPPTLAKAAAAGFVSGHFPFGIDGLLPSPSHYITLIRDPVEREVSSYNFHFQRGFIDGSVPLAAYAERRQLVDNPQTRMLAGREAMSGSCTEETFALALQHLETRFTLIGAVPHVHEYICALLGMHGWPPVLYARAQLTAVRRIETIDSELRELLQGYHRFDLRLHEFATLHWQRWARRHILSQPQVADDQDILVIPPDYYTTRRSYHMKGTELPRLAAGPDLRP
jgi:Sulfotransferase family